MSPAQLHTRAPPTVWCSGALFLIGPFFATSSMRRSEHGSMLDSELPPEALSVGGAEVACAAEVGSPSASGVPLSPSEQADNPNADAATSSSAARVKRTVCAPKSYPLNVLFCCASDSR